MIKKNSINEVILVNSKDEVLGTMEKLEAHQKGLLHRAFSVFIFNDEGKMLLQKRASTKYHSANLWSNACCSHPAPNESIEDAAIRRVKEELSLDVNSVKVFSFEYKTEFENKLVEHELDHVLVGFSNEPGTINPDEVSELKFTSLPDLFNDLRTNPTNYSVWFNIILTQHWDKISTILEQRNLQTA